MAVVGYRRRFSPEFQPHLIDWLLRENETAAFWCHTVVCIIAFIQQGLNWKHEGAKTCVLNHFMCEPQYKLTLFSFSCYSVTKKPVTIQHAIYVCAEIYEVQTHLLPPLCILNSTFSMVIHYLYIFFIFDTKLLCVMLVVTHRASVVAHFVNIWCQLIEILSSLHC